MKVNISVFLVGLFVACSGPTNQTAEKPRPEEWQGSWKAEWVTPPESYPDVENMAFTMDGSFVFNKDSLTVNANGFEGCIFNVDTLSHTQLWYVENDTLFLLNDPEVTGMTYQIKEKSDNMIQLQLMEDIFVTLTK